MLVTSYMINPKPALSEYTNTTTSTQTDTTVSEIDTIIIDTGTVWISNDTCNKCHEIKFIETIEADDTETQGNLIRITTVKCNKIISRKIYSAETCADLTKCISW